MTVFIKAKRMGIETLGTVNRFQKGVRKHGEKLYYLDLGGAPIFEEPPTHRSRCGILTSLIVLFIMAFFIILTISQFSKGVPSIIYTSEIPSSYLPFKAPPVGVLFKDGSGKDIYNTSLLHVKYTYVTIQNQDALPRIKVPLDSIECSFDGITVSNSANVSKLTTKAACPNETVMLTGTFELPIYQYLDIEIQRCQCPANSSDPCGCATDAEFNEIFWAGSLNLIVVESIPSYSVMARKVAIFPDDPDLSTPPTHVNNTRAFYWKNVQAFLNRVDVFIRRKTIFNGPRYIFDYKFTEFYTTGNIMARPDDFIPGDPLLFKAYIRMDYTDVQEMRQSPQLLQLIGSWGALWSFFSLTVLAIIRFYNKKAYHRQDHIDKLTNELIDSTNQKNIEMTMIRNGGHHHHHHHHHQIDLGTSYDSNNIDPNNNNNNNNNNQDHSNLLNSSVDLQGPSLVTTNVQVKRHSPKNILYASSNGSLENYGWRSSFNGGNDILNQSNNTNNGNNNNTNLTQSIDNQTRTSRASSLSQSQNLSDLNASQDPNNNNNSNYNSHA